MKNKISACAEIYRFLNDDFLIEYCTNLKAEDFGVKRLGSFKAQNKQKRIPQ